MDDGCVITIVHLSLRLRCTKNLSMKHMFSWANILVSQGYVKEDKINAIIFLIYNIDALYTSCVLKTINATVKVTM